MIPRIEKRCSHCKTTKPIDSFGPDVAQASGFCTYCRKCKREYRRTPRQREANLEKQRRRACNKPEAMTEMRRKYKDKVKHTPRYLASRTLRTAVQRGIVNKPESCSRCEAKPGRRGLHGHHHDYSKPLAVEWLCRPCHDNAHGRDVNRLKGDEK